MKRIEINCSTGEQKIITMTQKEIDALPVLTAEEKRAVIQHQIDALERAQLMPRVTREALLGIAVQQYTALGMIETQAYSANIGYRKLRDFETQIIELRDQMVALI